MAHLRVTVRGMPPRDDHPDLLGHDDHLAALTAAVRALAPDTTLVWTHDLARPADDSHTGFIDVYAPAVCDQLKLGWAWTVTAAESSDPLALVVPYDHTTADGEPAWTTGSLNRALEAWISAAAGRQDVAVVFDPKLHTPLVRRLLARRSTRLGASIDLDTVVRDLGLE